MVGLESEALHHPFDHGLGGIDLLGQRVGVASTSRMTAFSMSIR
jgi:hypothetical protein